MKKSIETVIKAAGTRMNRMNVHAPAPNTEHHGLPRARDGRPGCIACKRVLCSDPRCTACENVMITPGSMVFCTHCFQVMQVTPEFTLLGITEREMRLLPDGATLVTMHRALVAAAKSAQVIADAVARAARN